jgi:hypothetical protein
MEASRINDKILESVNKSTQDDSVMKGFIHEMLFTELEHPGEGWHFKDSYKKKIKECSKDWGDKDAHQ